MQHLLTLRCIIECREMRPFIYRYHRRRRHSRDSFLRPVNFLQMETNDSLSFTLKISRFPIQTLNAHGSIGFPNIQSVLSPLIFSMERKKW